MAATSFTRSLFTTPSPKYDDFLVGNAAYNPSSFESIATVTLGSNTSSMTFSSIPSTYSSLQLRVRARSSRGAATADSWFTINSDTAANYVAHTLQGNGTAAAAGSGTSQNNIYMNIYGSSLPADTATSGINGTIIVDIIDYASTSKYKTTRTFGGFDSNGSGTIYLSSGLWMSTSAISSLQIYATTGFVAGSTVALYGVK